MGNRLRAHSGLIAHGWWCGNLSIHYPRRSLTLIMIALICFQVYDRVINLVYVARREEKGLGSRSLPSVPVRSCVNTPFTVSR